MRPGTPVGINNRLDGINNRRILPGHANLSGSIYGVKQQQTFNRNIFSFQPFGNLNYSCPASTVSGKKNCFFTGFPVFHHLIEDSIGCEYGPSGNLIIEGNRPTMVMLWTFVPLFEQRMNMTVFKSNVIIIVIPYTCAINPCKNNHRGFSYIELCYFKL